MSVAAVAASAVRTRAADDCDASVANIIGVIRNERGCCHSLSRERTRASSLVEAVRSASATDIVSFINDDNVPCRSITRHVVIGRRRHNRRCQIP